MEFEIEHTIRIPCDQYFEVVLSDDFNQWVQKRLRQDSRTVIRHEELEGVVERVVRSERELSPKAQKWFKTSRLIIEERLQVRKQAGEYSWEYVPRPGAKRFQARGTGSIEPAGPFLKRRIQGRVQVSIPLLGKRIERRIVDWLRANMARVGEAIEDFYRQTQERSSV